MNPKTCEHCKWWGKPHVDQHFKVTMAKCGHDKLQSYYDDGALDPGYETEGIETGQRFGCIHFEQK